MEIASRQEEEAEQEAKDGGARARVGRGTTAIAAATIGATATVAPILLLRQCYCY